MNNARTLSPPPTTSAASAAVALNGLMGPIKVDGKDVAGVPPIMPPHNFMNMSNSPIS